MIHLSIALLLWASPASPQSAPPQSASAPRIVAVVLHEGVDPLSLAAPLEVLDLAAHAGPGRVPWFRILTVAPSAAPVSTHGISITGTHTPANCPTPDILVIPSGRSSRLYSDQIFLEWLQKAGLTAEVTLSVGTGTFALGYAGLLDGRQVTTRSDAIAALRVAFPKTHVQAGRRYLADDRWVTVAGNACAIDGALHLVARTLGLASAFRVARHIQHPWQPYPEDLASLPSVNPRLDKRGQLLEWLELRAVRSDWAGATRDFYSFAAQFPDDGSSGYRLATAMFDAKQFPDAINVYSRNAEFAQGRSLYNSLYNLACAHALIGNKDAAFDALNRAIESGFVQAKAMMEDGDLASLRGDPRFSKLVHKAAERAAGKE